MESPILGTMASISMSDWIIYAVVDYTYERLLFCGNIATYTYHNYQFK